MNWYKVARIKDGNYILGIDGELIPCHSKSFKDSLPFVVDRYNILTENTDPNSKEYFNEVLENGIAFLTIGESVNVSSKTGLNPQQENIVRTIKNR